MDVPFICQLGLRAVDVPLPDVAEVPSWGERGCAVACATMVLHHYGREVEMAEVLRKALHSEAFDPARGWRHSGLVAMFQTYGLTAYRRNWRLLEGHESAYLAGRAVTPPTLEEMGVVRCEMLSEGLWTVRRLLAEHKPVIVSTYRPAWDRSSIGHQIVLLGWEGNDAVYHDPVSPSGAWHRCGIETFKERWKGTAIVAYDGSRLLPSSSS
jgi:hypothetical protein